MLVSEIAFHQNFFVDLVLNFFILIKTSLIKVLAAFPKVIII